ncbi:MAG: prenyltransferase [Anaerolineae bacterium]|nr:prenyltransferase [Anaerolineae bacterium]
MKDLMGPMRPPFLILTPACVLLGLSTAIWSGAEINFLHVVLVLIGAMAAHISVNTFNEYFDFRSSLDTRTQRTPFSGGSGTLPARPGLDRQTLATAVITLVITGLIGVYFLVVRGWLLLPLGLLGMIVVFIYTPWVTRSPILCLIAPGLGFGLLMVMGTHFALTGQYSWTAFVASLVPFFLVNNLLLLNQFPDVGPDRSVGRKHFPIVIGNRASSLIYGAFLLSSFLSIVVGVAMGYLPMTALIGLGALLLAVPAFLGAYRYAENMEKLAPAMGLNVIINIVMPVLVAIGLFIA